MWIVWTEDKNGLSDIVGPFKDEGAAESYVWKQNLLGHSVSEIPAPLAEGMHISRRPKQDWERRV